MTRAATSWPKAYIIELYAKAVEHGFVWVQPITQEKAISLSKSFYNARRRADSTNKAWMKDEYHLCTFGNWEQLEGDHIGQGRVPVLFSALPDGQNLPDIVPARPEEITGRIDVRPSLPAPSSAAAQDFLAEGAPTIEDIKGQLTLGDNFDAGSFVARMRKKIED